MSHNSDHTLEPPWGSWSNYDLIPENPIIGVVVNHLEHLLRHKEKLSCPNDERDIQILSFVRCVLNSVRYLIEQQDLSDTRKMSLIRTSRLSIKEANNYIEKMLKIRSR